MKKHDVVVIGGGIIGLSIAFEALQFGWDVAIVDKTQITPQTSLASAGILPATNRSTAVDPFDQLRALSDSLHTVWQPKLREISGIDNQLRKCGTLFVALSPGEVASLRGQENAWAHEAISVQMTSPSELGGILSAANESTLQKVRRAAFVPDEHLLNIPLHLEALQTSCQKLGAKFYHGSELHFQTGHSIVESVDVDSGITLIADRFCLAAGSWSGQVASELGFDLSMEPVRGQILLFKLPQPLFPCTLYEGSQYIVSRQNGQVLVGSTLERAGFDNSNTDEATRRLEKFAAHWSSKLSQESLVRSWAGLRPGTHDGLPYLGIAPGFENVFVATGHLRSGIHMSTGTAVVVNQLMRNEDVEIDLSSFRPNRG